MTCGAVAAPAVGDNRARHLSPPLQPFVKARLCDIVIQSLLYMDIQPYSLLSDRTSQRALFASDRHDPFLETPAVAETAPAIAEVRGKSGSVFLTSLLSGFITDAPSTLGEQLLSIPNAVKAAGRELENVRAALEKEAMTSIGGML